MKRISNWATAAAAFVSAACNSGRIDGDCASGKCDKPGSVVDVQILAINDFHGNLEEPEGTNGLVFAPADDPVVAGGLAGVTFDEVSGLAKIPAGGAAFLGAHVDRLRAANPHTVVVSAGDLTGASPLVSNLFLDEPTVLAMNAIGLDYEAVGNHDFDRGLAELLRLQHGGCAINDCTSGQVFAGASFQYLAANVTEKAKRGMTIFPAYDIRELAGASIGFIGMTLEGTPGVSSAKAVQDVAFADEVATVNALVPELEAKGVSAIVLILHEGATQSNSGTYDTCESLSGALLPILDGLDPAIDVVVSGHTHKAYNCVIDDRIVTSAASSGRLITQIQLRIDTRTRTVVSKTARNVVVTRDIAPHPGVEAVVTEYVARAAPLASRIVGFIAADLTRKRSGSCETTLGNVVADSRLAASQGGDAGAQIAFGGSPGGLRADLPANGADKPPGAVSYADAFAVQPFGNLLVTVTMTGAHIQTVLEGQVSSFGPNIWGVSSSFRYAYDWDPEAGKLTVNPGSMALDGVPINPAKSYRVTIDEFTAAKPAFAAATDRVFGVTDLDAFNHYLETGSTAASPLAVPALDRITGDGCR